ncbi:peptidase family S58-domain-containing protein [Flagelloscypha sp. PMI_526]|nr:peptidase family S58-domain-containing protein [Flagelloscypha sp. PMI_526]
MSTSQRIRDLGYKPGQPWLHPGTQNAITDVPGVEVGVVTLRSGQYDPSSSEKFQKVVKTGVTVIQPRQKDGVWPHPVFASVVPFNGAGELTGSAWVNESGYLYTPIAITGTRFISPVLAGALNYFDNVAPNEDEEGRVKNPYSGMIAVVGETLDLLTTPTLNPVKPSHFQESIEDITRAREVHGEGNARPALEYEGSRGGGTGMQCLGFKGGNGTSSRLVPKAGGGSYTVGIFVQANFGISQDLTIRGVPVGRILASEGSKPSSATGDGSIIIVLATDAPLVPHQLTRLLRRIPVGLARVGFAGHHFSGDIGIGFSTQQTVFPPPTNTASAGTSSSPIPGATSTQVELLDLDHINKFFYAVEDAVEEAVLNVLCAGETEVGWDGMTLYGFPNERVKKILQDAGVVD